MLANRLDSKGRWPVTNGGPKRKLSIREHPFDLESQGPLTNVRLPGHPRILVALLDTGADSYFISNEVAERAGLEVKGCEDTHGLFGQAGPMPIYDSGLILVDAGDLLITGKLIGCCLEGIDVVLGRPLFLRSTMCYRGRAGEVDLYIEESFDPESLLRNPGQLRQAD